MRLIDLKYIQTVAEEGSISKAALKLYISQPSLSNAIKKIETDLGASIFSRTKNGLILTQIGSKYFIMANNILKIYADFENDLYEMDQLAKGKAHFGITNNAGSILLPSILPTFEKMAPGFDVSFEENRSLELIELLKRGKLDFAVLHIEPSYRDDPSIEYHSISTSQFLLATARNHPCCQGIVKTPKQKYPSVDLTRFQNERFILTDYDQMSRNIAKRIFRAYNFTPPKTVVTRNLITAAKLAGAQFGVTFYPEMFLSYVDNGHDLDLYTIGDGSQSQWELVVATLSQAYIPKSTQYFTKLIQEHFRPM